MNFLGNAVFISYFYTQKTATARWLFQFHAVLEGFQGERIMILANSRQEKVKRKRHIDDEKHRNPRNSFAKCNSW
jgi:hypothetical protein